MACLLVLNEERCFRDRFVQIASNGYVEQIDEVVEMNGQDPSQPRTVLSGKFRVQEKELVRLQFAPNTPAMR